MLKDMQWHGVTQESNSPWPSPIILAWKKNRAFHFCVDYKKLSDITKKDLTTT
jgi:hypothetical protein